MNLFSNGKTTPNNGYYVNIRSSEHFDAMLVWDTLHFDPKCQRYIEYSFVSFDSYETGFDLIDKIGCEIDKLEYKYEDICVRETSWEVSCKPEDTIISEVHFYMTEKRYGEIHSLNFNLSNLTMQELAVYTNALYRWHQTGRIVIDKLNCVPFWFYNE